MPFSKFSGIFSEKTVGTYLPKVQIGGIEILVFELGAHFFHLYVTILFPRGVDVLCPPCIGNTPWVRT
jgi:hypothetical protein